MLYPEAEAWLFSRRRMGMKYGLDRILNLMNDMGNPQKDFRTIHVVGTNGKGSTTALLAEIARHLGYRAGRNTSPHLLDFRERIAVDNRWIGREEIIEFISEYRDLLEAHSATFFEIITAIAAWFFKRENVDWVIAEAGLGGRFDASRIFQGEGTIFTGVQIEHSRILGKTRPLIAAEKVAIAAPETSLIAAVQTGDVESVIDEAISAGSLKRILPEKVAMAGLPGDHQKRNASLAFSAALNLFGRPRYEVERAFEQACDSLTWPGRLDLRKGQPSILFDVAHNPEAIEQLIAHVADWPGPVPAVVGILADKPWKRMVELMSPVFDPVVATTPLSERKLDASELAKEFRSNGADCHVRESIPEALELCRTMGNSTIAVTGSFFVVGEAMLTAWKRNWIEQPAGEASQAIER